MNTSHGIPPIIVSKILTKNYIHPLCDRPCKFNGLLKSFGVPKIKILTLEKKTIEHRYEQNTNTDF